MATDLTNYNNPYKRSPGISAVGSYQMAGKPYLTGGLLVAGEEKPIEFPNVTKEIFIQGAQNGNINLTFASTGSKGSVRSGYHYLTVPSAGIKLDVMCRRIFVHTANPAAVGDFQVYASLTGIDASEMFHLTGSGISE